MNIYEHICDSVIIKIYLSILLKEILTDRLSVQSLLTSIKSMSTWSGWRWEHSLLMSPATLFVAEEIWWQTRHVVFKPTCQFNLSLEWTSLPSYSCWWEEHGCIDLCLVHTSIFPGHFFCMKLSKEVQLVSVGPDTKDGFSLTFLDKRSRSLKGEPLSHIWKELTLTHIWYHFVANPKVNHTDRTCWLCSSCVSHQVAPTWALFPHQKTKSQKAEIFFFSFSTI